MKQKDVLIGKSYLFYYTDSLHKKDMIGSVVTVVGSESRSRSVNFHAGIVPTGISKKPKRYKLSNGRYANAGELKELKQ